MRIRIWGARGSIPTPLKPEEIEDKIFQAIMGLPDIDLNDESAVRAYIRELPALVRGTASGNTTCVEIEADGQTFIIDAGSGLRELGLKLMEGPCGRGQGVLHLFFTHTHWDHVQGFPFFFPAYVPGNRLIIYSIHDVQKALADQQDFRFFPLPLAEMKAQVEFVRFQVGQPFSVGRVRINTIENAHPGRAYSYRFEDEHSVFVHASDSEYKHLDHASVRPHLEFFHQADALIFDAQYTLRESWQKADWGHSSALIGVDLARAAGVKKLILFHHDPTYSDKQLQDILSTALAYQKQEPAHPVCEVLIAYEGLALDLTPAGAADFQLAPDGETAILTPTRIFSTEGVEQLQEQLSHLEQSHAPLSSIIDLSRVETLTLAGLKALVMLLQERPGTAIVLVAPSAGVQEMIRLGGYQDYFAVYPSVEAAMAAIQARETLNLPGHVIKNRYQIQEKVHENQLGAILKATDLQNNQTVILKLINPAFSLETIKRLKRQTQQLLGADHPHLTKILTWDQDAGHYFLVEEYMAAPTLHTWLASGPAEQAARIAEGIMLALDYGHSRGVLHTGLTPQSVFVTETGVRVSSFGLGRVEEGRQLLRTPLLVLNPAYISPEQILGQSLDTRTDLYSLGVILYQLFTGRLPFEGTVKVTMEGHLSRPPRPPRELNPAISLSLEHLILKLLAKNPNERYASARQVLAVWNNLGAHVESPARRRGNPLVDREKQLQTLLACWDEASAGRGQIVFIEGESGIGKSSLAHELAARSKAPVVLTGYGQEGERTAYYLFAQVLCAYVATVPPELFDERAQPLLSNLTRLVPEIYQILPDLSPPWPLEPEQEQLRLMVSLTQFIRQATEKRPWLLILDDLQWADPGSLELFRYLSRHLPALAILVLGLYRETELGRGHPLWEMLRDLGSHPTYRRFLLERLDRQGVERVLADMWQQPVPAAFIEKIYQHTEGNPLYIEEVAKGLVEEGTVAWQDGRLRFLALTDVNLPSSVHEAVWRRIAHLNRETQALLHQAAVLGQTFKFDDLQEMSGRSGREVLESLDTALERQLVQEVPGDTMLRFRHFEIQRVLYADLGPLRRRILHRQAGEALERRAMPRPERIAVELVYHFGEAGETGKALVYGLEAARQAQVAYANDQALERYNQVLALLDLMDPEERPPSWQELRFLAHKSIGEVLTLVGRYDAALVHCTSAWQLFASEQIPAVSPHQLADLCRQTAEIHERRSEFEVALEWLGKGFRFLDENEPGPELARLYILLGWVRIGQGRYEAAQAPLQRALALAQSTHLRQVEASSFRRLGSVAWHTGNYGQAMTHWRHSLGIYQEIGDQQGESKALNNLGLIMRDRGDYLEAKQYFEQALAISQEIGDRWHEGLTFNNLSYTLRGLGNYEATRWHLEQALAISQEIGDRQLEGLALGNLSYLFYDMGHNDLAWEYSQQVLAIAQQLNTPRDLAEAYIIQGHVLTRLGRLPEAAAAYQQAMALREELGQLNLTLDPRTGLAAVFLAQGELRQAQDQVEHILRYAAGPAGLDGSEDPIWVYLTCYWVLQAGQDPRAGELLRVAYQLLQAQANRISDQATRRMFLENIPAHREIVALWESRGD
ncbi:MAG: tetratricopeptide repeat protein [Chloroflexi bacterium]|nr:tetratricopeptide repeat protein [Chloroflexota bacterium]